MDKEAKKIADKIYKVGLKNGSILMKNKILKRLNRDWTLPVNLMIKVLKIINKIK